jgi:hypothetical protein
MGDPGAAAETEMFPMSLPTDQQRVLERIEGKLTESDPRLASLFSIFTRLTWAEKMPWIEQIRVRPVAYRIARMGLWFRGLSRRPAARVRAMLLLPAALTAMACALVIAFGFPGSSRPVNGAKAPVGRELVLKSRELMGRARVCRGIIRLPILAPC